MKPSPTPRVSLVSHVRHTSDERLRQAYGRLQRWRPQAPLAQEEEHDASSPVCAGLNPPASPGRDHREPDCAA